jgi:NAD-dependent dihydropyrimidine dehydrogenase PreA subunit
MIKPTVLGRIGHDITHRGVSAWLLSGALFTYYLLLYFTDAFTPAAKFVHLDDKWTLDALLYTLAIVIGGAFVLRKYRHNPYQLVRTSSVMFVQVTLAFALPLILRAHHHQDYYFSYFWPLTFDYWNPNVILKYPLPLILYSFLGSLFLVPLLGLLFGKRWYCSWVCGCGGLANTAGDSFRQHSSKSSAAWKFEKVSIYSVLALCLLLTALLFVSFSIGGDHPALANFSYHYQTFYYFGVTVMLSGVIGTGVYPIGGTRFWCRNFCPMAALLGLGQKLGRYRITVKKDMCISCGLCSKYCEMGIDVRSYAQANRNFTRASCVGCGICSEVCPRGVLRLENVRKRDPQEQLVQINWVVSGAQAARS